jgi:hypothetical protein
MFHGVIRGDPLAWSSLALAEKSFSTLAIVSILVRVLYLVRPLESFSNVNNGIVRQQTGRWHRRQNKFGKLWEQTKVTARLVVGYFNWVWQHSRFGTTAAQRAELTDRVWTWDDVVTYPTIL